MVWDLKTNQQIGKHPLSLQIQELSGGMRPHGGHALSWWGPNHLLLWGMGSGALVINATTGQPLRELQSPYKGRIAAEDCEGRLWYVLSYKADAGKWLVQWSWGRFPTGQRTTLG